MEMLRKTNDAQEKKKVVVNFGRVARGGGDGGIGTVILWGGVLATAAFASAFIVRKKGRCDSGNNSNRKAHNPPTPLPAVVTKENEQDEANDRKQFTFLDASLHVTNHPSSETRKEIEINNDTQGLVLDEKPCVEINGGPPVADCDGETTQTSEQIPSSINPEVPENNVISDSSVTNGGEFHLPVVEETLLPLELENVRIESLKRDVIDEITEECNGFKEVKAGGESVGDGEISEVKCEESIEEIKEDVAGIGLKLSEEGICGHQEVIDGNGFVPETFVLESHCKDGLERILPVFETPVIQHENVNGDKKQGFLSCHHEVIDGNGFMPETFVLESHCKDGQERILPVFETPVINHENANGDKKQGFVSSEVVEIIHEDDVIEEGEENQVKHIEEAIMPEKCEEENKDQQSEMSNEQNIPCQKIEENGCIDIPTPENIQFGDYDKDVQILTISTPEHEMIFHKDIEVSKEDAASEEEVVCQQQKDPEDEVDKNSELEDLSETIDAGVAIAKDEKNIIEDFIDETVDIEHLSDEVEQNSEGTEDSSMESNVAAVWPDIAMQESFIETQQMKLINQEVEGKFEEDITVKQGKPEVRQAQADKSNSNKIIADNTHITANVTGASAKSLFQKYVVDMATLKYYSANSNTRRILVATIPVLSSLSCSWFFGLSFDKLCLVVLLTIVLSKSMIIE